MVAFRADRAIIQHDVWTTDLAMVGLCGRDHRDHMAAAVGLLRIRGHDHGVLLAHTTTAPGLDIVPHRAGPPGL